MLKDWKEISSEIIEKNQFVAFEKRVYEMPDGLKRDYFLAGYHSGMAVFALTKDNKVIMVKEFRPGPKKWLLDLPAGKIDENEQPETTVSRELLEETGYRSAKVKYLGKYYQDAYLSTVTHCYFAFDCEFDAGYELQESDLIEVKLLEIEEFEEELKKGEMIQLPTALLGLNYLRAIV